MIILYSLITALAGELSFVIGLVIGSIVSIFGSFAFTILFWIIPPRGGGRFSAIRAFFQGACSGLVAGLFGLLAVIFLGRYLSVPDHWLLLLAIVPPFMGEFGNFIDRFLLKNNGTPNRGLFVPLGRVHAAAKAPFENNNYHKALYVFRERQPEETKILAAQVSSWLLDWMSWGLPIGAITSMIYLAKAFHLYT